MFAQDSSRLQKSSSAGRIEWAEYRPGGNRGCQILPQNGQSGVLCLHAPGWQEEALRSLTERTSVMVVRKSFSGRTSFFELAASSAEEFTKEVAETRAVQREREYENRVKNSRKLGADEAVELPNGDVEIPEAVEFVVAVNERVRVRTMLVNGDFIAAPHGAKLVKI